MLDLSIVLCILLYSSLLRIPSVSEHFNNGNQHVASVSAELDLSAHLSHGYLFCFSTNCNRAYLTRDHRIASPTLENFLKDVNFTDQTVYRPGIQLNFEAFLRNYLVNKLFFGNSSLNDKLEALETKLCGKIMAMKSYFMDELRSCGNKKPP